MIVLQSAFVAAAAINFILGLIQAMIWGTRRQLMSGLFVTVTFGASTIAILEVALLSSSSAATHDELLVWLNLAIAIVVVGLVWLIQLYLRPKGRGLAVLITTLWSIGMVVNFLLPGNLTFSEVTAVEKVMTPWGAEYFVTRGVLNDWVWTVNLATILVPWFTIRSSLQAEKSELARDGWIVSAGIVLFILLGGGLAGLTDQGMIQAPYMVGVCFLTVSFAMAWVLARNVVRAESLTQEMSEARYEAERIMRTNLLGEMVAALAHELNQPLTAILGNAQAAEKFLDSPNPSMQEIREILQDIVRDDKRARDIILNIRELIRGDNGKDQTASPEMELRNVLQLLQGELHRHRIKVEVSVQDGIPKVCGGSVAIQQIIMNLIVNAETAIREADAPRREISIGLRESENGAEIVVRDFGPGIAEDFMQSLFEPFKSTRQGSLGMGLAICQRIAENQGGRLTAENAEGGGAKFTLWLPECPL